MCGSPPSAQPRFRVDHILAARHGLPSRGHRSPKTHNAVHPRPPYPPVEPPSTPVHFPDPLRLGANEVAAVSRTLGPSVVLAAYRRGIFPWPVSSRLVPWVSPDPRAIFPLENPPHWS